MNIETQVLALLLGLYCGYRLAKWYLAYRKHSKAIQETTMYERGWGYASGLILKEYAQRRQHKWDQQHGTDRVDMLLDTLQTLDRYGLRDDPLNPIWDKGFNDAISSFQDLHSDIVGILMSPVARHNLDDAADAMRYASQQFFDETSELKARRKS